MGSISSPSGPSISGYDQTMIANDISSTQTAYTSALSNFLQLASLIVTNPLDYTTNYENAVAALQTAATNYGTALARQQLFVDAGSSSTVSSAISSLSGNTIQPGTVFQGLTSSDYQALTTLNTAQASDRTTLVNAFNTYRYVEWKISDTRSQILIQQAEQVYDLITLTSFDPATLNSLNSTLQSLLNNDRPQATQALNSALTQYTADYGSIDSTLINDIATAQAQVAGWSAYITNAQDQATTQLAQLLQTAQNNATALQTQHYVDDPTTNTAYTQALVAQAAASYLQSIQDFVQSGLGSASSLSASTPVLPKGSQSLSISAIMSLLSQVQLMIQKFSHQMSDADSKINAFRRALAQSDVEYYLAMRSAQNQWASIVKTADIAYNQQVVDDNLATYSTITSIYNTYQQNPTVINGVIDQVNAQITQQNANNKAVVDATNAIEPAIIATLNTSNTNVAQTQTVLDYSNQDTPPAAPTILPSQSPLSYPADIPLYSHISPLPAAPTVDTSTNPPTFPSQADIDTFNQTIATLASQIAPFATLVQDALMQATTGSTTGSSSLALQELYLRPEIPVRDNLLTSTYDGVFTFLYAFTLQLALTEHARQGKEEDIQKVLSTFLLKIGSVEKNPVPQMAANTSTTVAASGAVGGTGFSAVDMSAKLGAVSSVLQQIVASQQFSNFLKSALERISIQAGIETAGFLPDAAKSLSTFGIPNDEFLGVNATKSIEADSNKALISSFLREIGALSLNDTALHDTALQLLESFPGVQQLSQDDLKALISSVVALQKTSLLALGTLAAVGSGISPQEVLSVLFGTHVASSDIEKALLASGLQPATVSALLGAATSGTPESLTAMLQNLGLDSPTSVALFLLIRSGETNVSLSTNTPGGHGFVQALETKATNAGFSIPQGASSEQIAQSLLGQTQKKSATSSSATPTQINPSSPVVSGQDILQEYLKSYNALPRSSQSDLLDAVKKSFNNIPGLNDSEKASIAKALLSQQVTPTDLAALFALSSPGTFSANALTTDIIHKIFQKSKQDELNIEEQKKYDRNMEPVQQQTQRPSTLPPQTTEILQKAFADLSKAFSDNTFTEKVLTDFVKSVEKLSDFNKVAVSYLLDPAKSILREFSIITRSSGEKSHQTPVILGG